MINKMIFPDILLNPTGKEGDLFKSFEIYGEEFEIFYGYYEDIERENPLVDPMPIYPDFLKKPQFTSDGLPFVTKMQDACEYYSGKQRSFKECAECEYYKHGVDMIGICTRKEQI